MIYKTETGDLFETDPGVVVCINPNNSVTLHLGNGNTNNYIDIRAFEDSLLKGYNLFAKRSFKKLLGELRI